MKPFTVAKLVADLHISHLPPVARAVGRTAAGQVARWHRAMHRQLRQLHDLEPKRAPVIVAGDIWHTFRECAEIINAVISWIPHGVTWYAVSGQHDQPNHRLDQLHRSCYQTLVEAGKVVDLRPGEPIEVPGAAPLRLHGFPFGVPVEPLRKEPTSELVIDVAVVHQYVWSKKAKYHGAPPEANVTGIFGRTRGYDTVVIGDNHLPWGKERIYNCGAFISRTADERNHRPSVGLLKSDGSVERVHLDCSRDKWNRVDGGDTAGENVDVDVSGLVKELETGQEAIDYLECVKRYVRSYQNLSEGTKRDIAEAME